MARIYILHENDEWTAPLIAALETLELPYESWHLAQGRVDLGGEPPLGVFYNRMSASSHTRGHRYAPEFTSVVLSWLEHHDRRVVNGQRALALELSKVLQYHALESVGIRTPRTVAAVSRDDIVAAADAIPGPFITKHNRAGKGLGVRLFESKQDLIAYVDGPEFAPSVDGVTLVQEYIQASEPYITRLEFIDAKFLYAVKVDTSQGFLLCPADACVVDQPSAQPRFRILGDFHHPLVGRLETFLRRAGVEVAGVEFIVDREGRSYVYDINTNTNYNAEAEADDGRSGMATLAEYLGQELDAVQRDEARSRRAA